MILLYHIFIFFYQSGIRIFALWNAKARSWLEGRRHLFRNLQNALKGDHRIIWIHSASAGEFEQAKPIIEKLKQNYPDYKILATLFSPSGYNAARNYRHADYIFYLPADTSANAQRFADIVNPQLVIFVKYDFWYHYLKTINSKNIPLLLVSATFRKDQLFFKSYGRFYRNMLSFFSHIFVQDETSRRMLQNIGRESTVSGDTRFDRVAEIANRFTEVPHISHFINNQPALIAGSTWPDDERHLKAISQNFPSIKIIVAPHEINKAHLNDLKGLFPDAIFYSTLKDGNQTKLINANILVIDNIGMLSRLYRYATVTYIGGGFTKDGIHNTLEAAVYGKPVLFGPNYEKYREAKELIAAGGGFDFVRTEELNEQLQLLLSDSKAYQRACSASVAYIEEQKGATEKIMNYIQANRLLTN